MRQLSFLLSFATLTFSRVENRERLRSEFTRIKQDSRLDTLLDEAERIPPSTVKYWFGMAVNWNYSLSRRVNIIGLSIMMAWFLPAIMASAGLFMLVRGFWGSFFLLPLAALMFFSFSGSMLEGCMAAEEDPDYALFRGWLLTQCRKAGSAPKSVDALAERLLYFVQQSDPDEFRLRRVRIASWSKLFLVISSIVLFVTLGADAMGLFPSGSAIPLVLFFVMMAFLVLGGADMVYEEHRIPILNTMSDVPLPQRKYGLVEQPYTDRELSHGFNSWRTLYLAKSVAFVMLVSGWLFAWTMDGVGFASIGLFLLDAFAMLTVGIRNANIFMLALGLLFAFGLLAYRVAVTWKATGMKEARKRWAFFNHLATAKNLTEVISEEDFIDTYYFGAGQIGDAHTSNRELASRIVLGCMNLFGHRRASTDGDDQPQS